MRPIRLSTDYFNYFVGDVYIDRVDGHRNSKKHVSNKGLHLYNITLYYTNTLVNVYIHTKLCYHISLHVIKHQNEVIKPYLTSIDRQHFVNMKKELNSIKVLVDFFSLSYTIKPKSKPLISVDLSRDIKEK